MNNFEFDMRKPQHNIHKRKCEELRKIRVEMARTLGVPEAVRDEPCNFNGQCEGICPACYMEEKALMDRIYELSKSGIEFTLKENNAENSQEPELTSNKPLIFYNPPEPPKAS